MKGLIIKDILFLKNNFKLLIIVVIYGLFGVLANASESYISFLIPLALLMICISSFNYDEFNKWDSYAIALPVKKKDIVKSKYLFTIGAAIIGIVLGILISLGLSLKNGDIAIKDQLEQLFSSFAGVMLCVSLTYPAIYKFGSEKGRILLFVGAFGISSLSGFVISMIKKLNISLLSPELLGFINNYGLYIIIGIMFLFLFLSYKLSCKIYQKKEF